MHTRIPLFTLLLAIVLLALPSAAYAGGIPFFGPIIPPENTVCPASWGALINVINNIISLALTLAIVFIAPIMIAYAGFLLMTGQGNSGTISKAKGILWNTVVGIVIALAGWLIVDAIMAVLYKPDAKTGWTTTWSQLITSGGVDACLEQAGAMPGDTLNQADLSNLVVVPTFASNVFAEKAIRDTFTDAGVGVNKDPCSPNLVSSCGVGKPPSCTNLSSMREDTIDQVIALAKAVGSTLKNKYVYVTGGTEPGHACGTGNPAYSHQNGYKVDLNPSEVLSKYIREKMSPSPSTQTLRYVDSCGNQYVFESSPAHWDVTVKKYCPLEKFQIYP